MLGGPEEKAADLGFVYVALSTNGPEGVNVSELFSK
jgi:hypothetical protein